MDEISHIQYNTNKVVITSTTIMAITSAIVLNEYTLGNNISPSGITSATNHWLKHLPMKLKTIRQ